MLRRSSFIDLTHLRRPPPLHPPYSLPLPPPPLLLLGNRHFGQEKTLGISYTSVTGATESARPGDGGWGRAASGRQVSLR